MNLEINMEETIWTRLPSGKKTCREQCAICRSISAAGICTTTFLFLENKAAELDQGLSTLEDLNLRGLLERLW